MSGQQDQADPEVLGGGNVEEAMPNLDSDMDTPVADNDWTLSGIETDLTPLQYHYLSLLQRLVTLKNTYQADPGYEAWILSIRRCAIASRPTWATKPKRCSTRSNT